MKTELVLSGCSSKLTAHLGFMQCLQYHGLEVSRIRASSGGALVGALWASGLPLGYMQAEFERQDFAKLGALGVADYVRAVFTGYAAKAGSNRLWELLKFYLGSRVLEELHTPVEIMVSDLTLGELLILSPEKEPDFPIADAVYLSCSIPGHFKPHLVEGDDHLYRDGCIYKDFPIDLVGDPQAIRLGHKVESGWRPTANTSPWTLVHELCMVLFAGVDANGDASKAAVVNSPNVKYGVTSIPGASALNFNVSAEDKEALRKAGHCTGGKVVAELLSEQGVWRSPRVD